MVPAESIGERELWCAVIKQAYTDALHGVTGLAAAGSREHETHIAQQWFIRAGRDYRAICAIVGIDPVLLSNHVKQRLK